MRKNLFLTCALAFVSFAGVQAQDSWAYTVVTPGGGTEITHEVKGTEVTQHHVVTKAYNLPAATDGLRFTVVETNYSGMQYGGGCFFSLGEFIVRDAEGNSVAYTATSNADHNSGGAGTDGAGLSALNDGNVNNYFHSSWGGTEPGGLHYIELTFEEPIGSFSLEWYARPNHGTDNRPVVSGLTPKGVEFTADMCFAEYQFSVGDKVSALSELSGTDFYTFYVEAVAEFVGAEGDTTRGPGNVYPVLSSGGNATGSNTVAVPQNILQFVPTGNADEYYIYQPLSEVYYANGTADYNGANGWQKGTSNADDAQPVKFTMRNDGQVELSYVVNYEGEDVEIWIGYDMRGNLKTFPAGEKTRLESAATTGDYTGGSFGLPVDFGFQINKANVAAGILEPISLEDIVGASVTALKEDLQEAVDMAQEKYALYYEEFTEGEWCEYGEDVALAEKIAEANDLIASETAAPAALKNLYNEIRLAVVNYLSVKMTIIYIDMLTLLEDESIFSSADALEEGKYPLSSKNILTNGETAYNEYMSAIEGGVMTSITEASNAVAALEDVISSFEATVINKTNLPTIMGEAQGMPGVAEGNNMVWTSPMFLMDEAVNGVRFTFLANVPGNSGGGGMNSGFPMIALGEVKLYDADGDEITLTEENFEASATETNEGFVSSVARLCDGNLGVQGFYHSPWSVGVSERVWIELTFPSEMNAFSIKFFSRDKTTNGGTFSLVPKEIAITRLGETYDPIVFAEDPYNAVLGEQVTSLDQITDDGIYAIRGLLNTNLECTSDSSAVARWYTDNVKFHNTAVKSQIAFFIKSAGEGKYTIQSLATANYWASRIADAEEGEVIPAGDITGNIASTAYPSEAAKLNIVPATVGLPNTFVIYEQAAAEMIEAEVTKVSVAGDTSYDVLDAPYIVYMDWAGSTNLATRPVRGVQPWSGEGLAADLQDAWGDSLHFNKKNGEGQWEIYKLTMDTPNLYWLSNMVNIMDGLGYKAGNDPGCISVESLNTALAAAQKVLEDSVSEATVKDANAATAAANISAALVEVAGAERNPMVAGTYAIVSAYNEYFKKQGVEKAIYEDTDGVIKWGTKPEALTGEYVFRFTKHRYADAYVEAGLIKADEVDLVYELQNVASEKYVGGAEGMSASFASIADEGMAYLVREANGSTFNITNIVNKSWNMHTGGHSAGAGTGGTIVYWSTTDGCSAWYLETIDETKLSIEDLVVEGDDVVSVSYYTVGGAATSAPVKGVNIVKIVYANGAVETKKIVVE